MTARSICAAMTETLPKVAIVGAGLAGLTLAGRLGVRAQVKLFEKSRGLGGRMATRYAGAYEFDHGAQYFTVETAAFDAFLDPYKASGLIAAWPEEVAALGGARVSSRTKYVAAPRMNQLCKTLGADLDITVQTRIERLVRAGDTWTLISDAGEAHAGFDWVISAAPAPQSQAVLPDDFAGQAMLAKTRMTGCFSVMLGFAEPVALPFVFAKCAGGPVGVIAVNAAKPGRDTACSILLQSTNEWAETHMEDDLDTVAAVLIRAAGELSGVELGRADHRAVHRWRFAATPEPAGAPFLLDAEKSLAACGDWCGAGKVEAAFTSAASLAEALAQRL